MDRVNLLVRESIKKLQYSTAETGASLNSMILPTALEVGDSPVKVRCVISVEGSETKGGKDEDEDEARKGRGTS